MPMTLSDHCRLWYYEQGIITDRLPVDLSNQLYRIWVNYAFAGISGSKPNDYGIKPGKMYFEVET